MRRFYLVRLEDPSGVSGLGVVAGGVEYPDGAVSVRWFGPHPSTVAWDCLDDAMAVHGHGNKTRAVYVDPEQDMNGPQPGGIAGVQPDDMTLP